LRSEIRFFNGFADTGESTLVRQASEWEKLAALKNLVFLKLERGKSNEFDFLPYMATRYGYNGLSVVSASVGVLAASVELVVHLNQSFGANHSS
jgi:hypothetical protein